MNDPIAPVGLGVRDGGAPIRPRASLPVAETPAPALPEDRFSGSLAVRHKAAPAAKPPAQAPSRPVAASAPPTVLVDEPATAPLPGPATPPPPAPPPVPGDGFRLVAPDRRTPAVWLHDLAAHRAPGLYGLAATGVLDFLSHAAEEGLGVDLRGLLQVERTMYQTLAPSAQGYGGQVPLFKSLADGQAAYVNLGPGKESDSEHLMRLFAGMPLDQLERLNPADPTTKHVLTALIAKARAQQFPAFIDIDRQLANVTPTESIATASIASIAHRENRFGNEFADPRKYYNWLITRVDSNFRRTDPWLHAVVPDTHSAVVAAKDAVTPSWIEGRNADPFGFRPDPGRVQEAYRSLMAMAGGGKPPTVDDLVRFADTVVGLDRDLLSGPQTYWTKLLSELPADQRRSVMEPLARAWVVLNLVPPDDPGFWKVSPQDAPYIELMDRSTEKVALDRYDRAMAISEAVDHALDGLGLDERREFMDLLMGEIGQRRDALEAREERIRGRLPGRYGGLDIGGVLADPLAIDDPKVRQGLDELLVAMEPDRPLRTMTMEYAEMIRHRDVVKWIADRNRRYGDVRFEPLWKMPTCEKKPLIVGEFYHPEAPGSVSVPQAGPSAKVVLGTPKAPGEEPVKLSLVLEGGGGKGFAYVEALNGLRAAFENTQGTLEVDEFVGTSAGAITASIMAAGFTIQELPLVLQRLDFKKFYADYLWLMGGVDPKVRGLDRTGLFSLQTMYRTLDGLFRQKTGVEGRPVLFRDLPFKLKVVATVLNTDLPEDLKKDLGIGPDGRIVLSSENTPNMDVAAAVAASAAVPGFFQAPQVQVYRQVPDAQGGEPKVEVHRLQLVDGGVVNNFPVAHAKEPGSMLVALPTYFETPDGAKLTMLDFDPKDLPRVDAYNRQRYAQFAPQVAQLVQDARSEGVQRVVLALNLATPSSQTAPAVQGETRKATGRLHELAERVGLPKLSEKESRKLVRSNLEATGKDGLAQRLLVEAFLDKEDTFDFALCGKPGFQPMEREAQGLPDLALGVVAATLASGARLEEKLFER